MTKELLPLWFGCVLSGAFAGLARAQSYDLGWYTIDGGGAMFSTGGGFELSGTIGQPDANPAPLAGIGFELLGGFWGVAGPVTPVVVSIAAANPPTDNPFVAGTQPFRDILQTGSTPALTQGIGSATTPMEDTVTYSVISVTFSGTPVPAPGVANVTIACNGNGPYSCPSVSSVAGSGAGPYAVTLSGPIPPRYCTTLTFAGTVAGQKLQYQYLPGDIGLNGATSALDVQQLVSAIASGQAAMPANRPRYDVNRNGVASNTDVLRLVGLLNGLNTPQVWTGATVAVCP